MFLLNYNLANISLLSLERIEEGILETPIDLLFVAVGKVIILLLNWDDMHCQKDLLLSVMSLSHPDSYIVLTSSHTANPNSDIRSISSVILSPKGYCLINNTIW